MPVNQAPSFAITRQGVQIPLFPPFFKMRHFSLSRGLSYLLLAVALAGCDASKSSPAAAADAFFALLNKGQYSEAYESASFIFQAPISEATFVAIAKDLKLGD